MKIDFSSIILDFHDKPVMGPASVDGGAPEPLTLASVAVQALSRVDPKDDGPVKFELFKLALKVMNGGMQAIEPKDAELLKKRIGICWSPLVVGRSYDLLNGDMNADIAQKKVAAVK